MSALLEHMGVDHGCGDILVAQQGLHGPDASASLQNWSKSICA